MTPLQIALSLFPTTNRPTIRHATAVVAIAAGLLPGTCPGKDLDLAHAASTRPGVAARDSGSVGPTPPAFLYVVYCSGTVDKLDLAQPAKVASFQLSDRSGTPAAVAAAPSPGARPDSCLARPVPAARAAGSPGQHAVQVVASAQFYRGNDDGKKAYRLLTFSLPDWALQQQADLGRFDVLNGAPPRMVPGPRTGQWVPRAPEAEPDATAEIAGYAGGQGIAFARPTQWSGNVSLVEFAAADKPQAQPRAGAGFADRATRRFVRLAAVADAVNGPLRLAPGGLFAMREVQRPDQATALPDKASAAEAALPRGTGELRIYRTADGQPVATVVDARVAGPWHCIAITPTGWAVYTDRKGAYRFVALGRTFGNEPVEDSETDDLDGTRPGLVYSAH
ncbi:hypothetical protein [Acidovorax sp. SUPP3334]|uniref:hypothetical protein n=1 Tax=Acidovorax sp. SUPP3334 TaxID=2920881 RepID=UPI0023DE4F6A|nr:hypothetical protein [Acidovorax sp. SUPP3334]GKT24823.1 hypothetical protein AVHM3334_15980 [Acidovorax sp. SUPP3334]